jgi:hypothetical protein
MLDHLKNNAPSKREIAQLKNQVAFPQRSHWLQGKGAGLFSSLPPPPRSFPWLLSTWEGR